MARRSAAELARLLDVPTNRITGVLSGQRAITALRLAHFFGTSAELWLKKALPRLRHQERVPARNTQSDCCGTLME